MSKPDKWVKRWDVWGTDTYVVALDRDGNFGCSCPRWKFQREKPREDCKHIQKVKRDIERPEMPWPGTRAALEALPPGPDRTLPDGLGDMARQVLEYAEKEYAESGYAYSGCIHLPGIERALALESNDDDTVWGAIRELTGAGLLIWRDCQRPALELPTTRRWWLVRAHMLYDKWESGRSSSLFYPNSRHGEVCQVWQELIGFVLCPRCRTWNAGGEHVCRPEPWMAYLKKEGDE